MCTAAADLCETTANATKECCGLAKTCVPTGNESYPNACCWIGK